MRIIKQSRKQFKVTKLYRTTCLKCDALIEYNNLDVIETKMVVCPTEGCGQYIQHFEGSIIPGTNHHLTEDFKDMLERIKHAQFNPEFAEKRDELIKETIPVIRTELEKTEDLDAPKKFVYLP